MDTFDPKPKLDQLHMTEFSRPTSKFASQMESGKRYFVQSPFKFRRAGRSGVGPWLRATVLAYSASLPQSINSTVRSRICLSGTPCLR